MMGKMDPYVLIKKGKEKVQTKTHDDAGQNPVWNQTFEIDIKDTKKFLEVSVRDEQTFSDREIGSTSIRVDMLCDGSSPILEKGWPLKFEEENAGTLNLKTEWIPNDTPVAIQCIRGKRENIVRKEEGFEGEMVKGKRTGKVK